MYSRTLKVGYILLNLLLLFVAGLRIVLPLYLYYVNPIISHLNYDRHIELTNFWMAILVPWDIILAVSGIRSILRNDREQLFENAFKLSVFGLVIMWMINGLGDRFQISAPYTMKCRMKQYNTDDRAKLIVDMIQKQFQCCGFNNLLSWTKASVPSSCCPGNICSLTNVYGRDCAHALRRYVETLNLCLLFANFPFAELIVSLCNCTLTDRLPNPSVIYELGDGSRRLNTGRIVQESYQQSTNRTSKETVLQVVHRHKELNLHLKEDVADNQNNEDCLMPAQNIV